MNARKADVILRYPLAHASITGSSRASFVLLALSGLALFHPALFWLTNLFGGGPWTRILHPFIGVLHGRGVLPLRRDAVARQLSAAARLDLAEENPG